MYTVVNQDRLVEKTLLIMKINITIYNAQIAYHLSYITS